MTKSKQETVKIEILADGVFVAEDEPRNKGDVETVPTAIADALVKNGHAKRN
jgi:hypothetical protein